MSLNHSPKIVTDNLIFAYDMQNKKSYKGKPTTNIVANAGIDCSAEYSGNDYPFLSVDITSYVVANWQANVPIALSFEGKRDYSVGGWGSGGDGYPVLYVFFGDWTWATTVGIGSYDWTYNSISSLMPNPAGKSIYAAVYHMNAGNPGKSYARNIQVEFSDIGVATPFVNGSRSSNGVLKDLTNNYSILANNLTYNTDGSFSFNGTSNMLSTPYIPVGVNFTISTWIKATDLSNRYGIISTRSLNEAGSWQLEVGIMRNKTNVIGFTSPLNWTWTSPDNTITTNTWYNIVYIRRYANDAGLVYVNGNNITPVETFYDNATGTTIPYTISNTTGPLVIGSGTNYTQLFPGSINNTQLYNKVLNEAEIKQNFNALRGRYGL